MNITWKVREFTFLDDTYEWRLNQNYFKVTSMSAYTWRNTWTEIISTLQALKMKDTWLLWLILNCEIMNHIKLSCWATTIWSLFEFFYLLNHMWLDAYKLMNEYFKSLRVPLILQLAPGRPNRRPLKTSYLLFRSN